LEVLLEFGDGVEGFIEFFEFLGEEIFLSFFVFDFFELEELGGEELVIFVVLFIFFEVVEFVVLFLDLFFTEVLSLEVELEELVLILSLVLEEEFVEIFEEEEEVIEFEFEEEVIEFELELGVFEFFELFVGVELLGELLGVHSQSASKI
jgi:hypothetical protein